MKTLAYLAVVLLCLTGGANAQSHHTSGPPPAEAQITTHNETDMPARMFASTGSGTLVAVWTVAPRASDNRTFAGHAVFVRADIDAGACSGAKRFSGQLMTTKIVQAGSILVYRLTGYIRHTAGKCTYRE